MEVADDNLLPNVRNDSVTGDLLPGITNGRALAQRLIGSRLPRQGIARLLLFRRWSCSASRSLAGPLLSPASRQPLESGHKDGSSDTGEDTWATVAVRCS
ncbi:MAG: hypothetical protein M3353_04545 [Actinomycetota bacterium]|nr:hypothetical protein [Actinomycetota bacterium]